ncbi:MAG: AAA family ATPase [Candidatus Competibacteraceae bacterium]|nr:AAA family ATPase [Candidatus Competibacteraceae bacterium]
MKVETALSELDRRAALLDKPADNPTESDAATDTDNPRKVAFRESLITAAALSRKHFDPVRWAVPGILPEGVTLLAGAPKIGKSWLILDIALAIGLGGKALGTIDVQQGDALYLALEDTDRRLKRRLGTLLPDGTPQPDRLTLATTAPRLDDGLIDVLEEWVDSVTDPRLIVIDTLAKIRPGSDVRVPQYERDYAIGGALMRLSERGVSVLVVHHTRKMVSDDPLELVSGTLGLSGGVDGIIVLQRARGAGDGQLYVTGRDVEDEGHYALNFDKQRGAWWMLGPVEQQPGGDAQSAILDLLEAGPMKPGDIAKALNKNRSTTRTLIGRMLDKGLLEKRFDGQYQRASIEATQATASTLSTLTVDNPNNGITSPNVAGVDAVDKKEKPHDFKGKNTVYSKPSGVDSETDWVTI